MSVAARVPCGLFDPWGALGEGSGWDLRVCPAAAPAPAPVNVRT